MIILKILRAIIGAIRTLEKRATEMATQIETLNAAVGNLQKAVSDLQGRIGSIPPSPDLTSAIAGIQGATDALNALAQPPAPAPAVPDAPAAPAQ